jgi:hypothetical protein
MSTKDKIASAGKDAATAAILGAVVKPAIHALGDKMETAKRPFWRRLVRFFRGKQEKAE